MAPLGFPDSPKYRHAHTSAATVYRVSPFDPSYEDIVTDLNGRVPKHTTTSKADQTGTWVGVGQTWAHPQALCNVTVMSRDGSYAGGSAAQAPSLLVKADCGWPTPTTVTAVSPSTFTLEYSPGPASLTGATVMRRDYVALVPAGMGCFGAAVSKAQIGSHKDVRFLGGLGSPRPGPHVLCYAHRATRGARDDDFVLQTGVEVTIERACGDTSRFTDQQIDNGMCSNMFSCMKSTDSAATRTLGAVCYTKDSSGNVGKNMTVSGTTYCRCNQHRCGGAGAGFDHHQPHTFAKGQPWGDTKETAVHRMRNS